MNDFNDCDDGTQHWSLHRGRFGSFKRSSGGEDDHPTEQEIQQAAEDERKRKAEKARSK